MLARLDATELSAGVRQAREGLEKSRRDAARMAWLVASDTAPRAAAEDTRTAEAIAEAQLSAAEFNLRHATLVSPDDGWVDHRLAEPGEVVAPGRAVLHVSGVGRGFVVRAALAERDVLGLRSGTPATVALDADPSRPLSGRVTEIGRDRRRAAPAPTRWRSRSTIRGAAALPSGLTAKVEIARTVPAAGRRAARRGGGRRRRDAAPSSPSAEGVARRVPVRIALPRRRPGRSSPAASPAIDRVVTDGAPRLADGARVAVVQ